MIMDRCLVKKILSGIGLVILSTLIFPSLFGGCGNRNIAKMSPREIIELEISSYMSADRDTLRKIMYFPPEMSEEDIKRKLSTNVADGGEKIARALHCEKVEYSRIIDANTAEVGTVITGKWFMFGATRKPFRQIILKKDRGIWKFHYTTHALSASELRVLQQNNPDEANTYYLLGSEMFTSNPKRSLRCLKKYLELAPKGFWVSKDLEMRVKLLKDIDFDKEENRILLEKKKFSGNELDWVYQIAYLARMFWEMGNIEKTEYYLNLGDEICKKHPKSKEVFSIKRFIEAKTEIENEMKRGKSGAEFY